MIPPFLKEWWRKIYHQLVEIDDTPHRKAGGLGLGVFLGIFPGMGPIAALVLSSLFHLNKAACVLGSVLTNSWLSIVTFILAVKAGAFVTGGNWEEIYRQCNGLIQDFRWKNLFDVSLVKILKPIMIGYIVVSAMIGLCVYVVTLTALIFLNKSRK
jgi:uncharacterized protein (DUF2062 family)